MKRRGESPFTWSFITFYYLTYCALLAVSIGLWVKLPLRDDHSELRWEAFLLPLVASLLRVEEYVSAVSKSDGSVHVALPALLTGTKLGGVITGFVDFLIWAAILSFFTLVGVVIASREFSILLFVTLLWITLFGYPSLLARVLCLLASLRRVQR